MVISALQLNTGGSGKAYVYQYDGVSWIEGDRLIPQDGYSGDRFGYSVAIDGNTILIGAPYTDDQGENSGSVYSYECTEDHWVEVAELLASDGATGDIYGDSVAVNGNLAIIGAQMHDSNGEDSGAAYIYDLDCRGTLVVSPDPLVSGEIGTFTITGMTPDSQTYLVYSFAGEGSTYVPQLKVVLDLHQPKLGAGPKVSDGEGFVEWSSVMPIVTEPHDVWFQGGQFENLTNVVETQIVP